MDIGDVIRSAKVDVNDHTFIIISDPGADPDEVVIVNFTSYDAFYKDPSCQLGKDDHPWLKHDTCISYRDAKVVTDAELEEAKKLNLLIVLDPASDELLGKILAGAELTEELPGKCRRVLERQGLIAT